MAKRTRRAKKEEVAVDAAVEEVVQEVVEEQVVEKSEKEEEIERKDVYLNRIKKEDKANKAIYKKSGTYICMNGHKVIVKYKNAAGSVYSRYWFNAKKHPDKMAKIKKDEGCDLDGVFAKLVK